ncbi:MAG: polysaccharide export protein [Gammaproteobacteria bacterium]|nr:polysaccharide export protein [Gammaproteobacteria bacterium]
MKCKVLFILLLLFQSTLALADSYRLGAGDLVNIVVYDEPDLSIETRLDSVGIISYPFIGDVRLAGQTVNEIKKQIVVGLKDGYLINPEVTVTITDYRQFFVNGRVKKPGGFAYQPGMTVQKAISLAGGFDTRADKDDIYLTRGEKGKGKKTTLEAAVQPGDVVTVERGFF